MSEDVLSRRDFLKASAVGVAALILPKPFRLEGASPQTTSAETELLPHQPVSGILISNNTPVSLFPLKSDYMYDFWKDSKHTVPATIENFCLDMFPLGFKNIYTSVSGEKYIRYVILPHTTGSKAIPIATIEQGNYKNGKFTETGRFYSTIFSYPADCKNGTEHSVFGEFYPNKIKNDLTALMAIDDWQQKNGGFSKGKEYSLLSILRLKERQDYVEGKTSSGSLVKGGGACLIATNFCKVVREAGGEILERWGHPTGQRYWSGPEAGDLLNQRNSDATIEIGTSTSYDFRWKQAQNGWLRIDAQVIPNGRKVKNDLGDEAQKSDAYLLITMDLVDSNPGQQANRIQKIRDSYNNYRTNPSTIPSELSGRSRYLGETPWSHGDENDKLLKSICPEEGKSDFTKELASEPFLKDLAELEQLINNYLTQSRSNEGVGTYLRRFSWYERQKDKFSVKDKTALEKFEAALRMLDFSTNLVKNEPVQCVGYAILLSSLPGNLNFKSIGGSNVKNAGELVPKEIKSGEKNLVVKDELTIRTVNTLSEIQPGDLFVEYGTGAGHIGGVIARKDVNGKTVLLLTDANRTNDGRVRIFEVNANNFDVALGPYPFKKVIIT